MATMSEIHSLNEINYKSKIKFFLLLILVFFLFVTAFLSFYPIGDKLKTLISSQLKGTSCNPEFDQIHMEWIMPKIVISDLSLPASCFERTGEPVKFSHVTINWHLINFSPFGLPFRIDTEMSGQPLSVYLVQGIGTQMVRLKDQHIVLTRLQPLLGENFKLSGAVTVDLNLSLANKVITHLNLKAISKDFQIPSQNIQGFTTPSLKLNDLYLEANAENPPRIKVDKLILGDADSPMRANFRGKIDLLEGNAAMSPIDLQGEVAFSPSFKEALPLIDMMFQSFTQKDGFYQIRLGGTLGAPKPTAP